ncbi:MAG: peptidylprolyl isomerase [Candidatus Nanoarchaeia archaeon]
MKKVPFFLSLSLIIFVTILLSSIIIYISLSNSNSQNYSELVDQMQNVNNSLVEMNTNYGTIYIELFLEESPITAGNFKKLIEDGFYDGILFHRIIEGFVIQGGDPNTKNESLRNRWGTGGPGYVIEDEFVEGLSNTKWTLSMANSGPNSGGSQFFINLNDNTNLDFDKEPLASKHPVFGKVISGFEVIEQIAQVETQRGDVPVEDVEIESALVVYN